MNSEHWLELLKRHSEGEACPGWDDVVVGYDLGILRPEAILAWAGTLSEEGPALRSLLELRGSDMAEIEIRLWAACVESTGMTPRPGHLRWERGQDRWRLALLREALEAPLTLQALGLVVEAIYEQVGCPEDMLGLWKREGVHGRVANLSAIHSFIARQERRLAEKVSGHHRETCYTGVSAGV